MPGKTTPISAKESITADLTQEQARLVLLWRFFVASALLVLYLVFRYFAPESTGEMRQVALAGVITVEYGSILAGLALRFIYRSRQTALRTVVTAEFVFDLCALGTLVYYSGGLFSEFMALFVFVAIASSGLLGPPLRYIILALAGAVFPALGLANWLGFGHELPGLPSNDMLLTVLARSLYYVGITALGSGFAVYLARYADRARSDLAATTLDLQRMRRYNEQILAAIPSGLVLANPLDASILVTNAAANQLLGTSLPSGVSQMLHEPRNDSSRGEIETEQGQILGYSITEVNLPNALTGKHANLIMFQDVTKYRRLERQVEAQDKLAAIGRLGANLAHEIRNPLTAISNVIQLLNEKLKHDNDADALLELASSEIQRLEKLLTEFLAFAKPSNPSAKAAEERFVPSEIVANILAHITKPPNAEYTLLGQNYPPCTVSGNRHAFQQVAYNLILNASQWAQPSHPVVACNLMISDSSLQLTVEDNGPGVRPENRSIIWEPFVSSRPQGTGLGLALVTNLAASLGGSVEYKPSQRLGGAQFVFSMPCHDVSTVER